MSGEIARVRAWEALDSRGTPTVACEVTLRDGSRASAMAPAGASTGRAEALELRDGGERYEGRGVRRAVAGVHDVIAPALAGCDAFEQAKIDALLVQLDGTPELGRLGANAILATSVANARAAAACEGISLASMLDRQDGEPPLLPLPMVNVISGGAHAGGAVDMQDFLVVPLGASCFAEAIEWAARVRAATRTVAAERGLTVALVADEGGLGPSLPSSRAALELLSAGIERSGLVAGEQVAIAIDVAASQFCDGSGRYRLTDARSARGWREIDAAALVDELAQWCDAHPIVSLEDPLAEEDWQGWEHASRRLGARVQLLGDDLLVTNSARLQRAVRAGIANAVLVKPNQCGTLTDARGVLEQAREVGYATVVSARSGETEEDWLADLAVGWRAGQIKVGSTMRSERTAKWNRLLAIEAEQHTRFAGRAALAGANPGRRAD